MINAVIHNKNNTLVIDFPRGWPDLQLKLSSIGITARPQDIPLTDNEEDDIRVILYSESDIGNHLVRIFKQTDTLADVNILDSKITFADYAIQNELETDIISDQYDSVKELLDDIEKMTYEAGEFTESFYFPLTANLDEEGDGETYEVDNRVLLAYESSIRSQVSEEQTCDVKNMAEYYYGNEGVKDKLVSADWNVEVINGELYGCVYTRLKEELTAEEKEALKEWITGQNSDGFGEGFEQHPLAIEEGDLYISFWNSGKDYFVYDKNEMDEYISQQSEQQMGGM